jgi:hypothetical protein
MDEMLCGERVLSDRLTFVLPVFLIKLSTCLTDPFPSHPLSRKILY